MEAQRLAEPVHHHQVVPEELFVGLNFVENRLEELLQILQLIAFIVDFFQQQLEGDGVGVVGPIVAFEEVAGIWRVAMGLSVFGAKSNQVLADFILGETLLRGDHFFIEFEEVFLDEFGLVSGTLARPSVELILVGQIGAFVSLFSGGLVAGIQRKEFLFLRQGKTLLKMDRSVRHSHLFFPRQALFAVHNVL